MINNPTEDDITNLFKLIWPTSPYPKLFEEYITSKEKPVLTSKDILEFLKSDSRLFKLYRLYCLFKIEDKLEDLRNKILYIKYLNASREDVPTQRELEEYRRSVAKRNKFIKKYPILNPDFFSKKESE